MADHDLPKITQSGDKRDYTPEPVVVLDFSGAPVDFSAPVASSTVLGTKIDTPAASGSAGSGGSTIRALLAGIFDKLIAGLSVTGPASQVVSGTLTRDTNTTQYTAGDLIAPASGNKYITLSISRANDIAAWVKRLRLKVNDSAWKGSTVRVHLFKSAPTISIADNAQLNNAETYAFSESNYIGYAEVTLTQQTNDATALVKGFVATDFICDPDTGTTNIYAVLECRSTPTPAASKVFTLTAECVRD